MAMHRFTTLLFKQSLGLLGEGKSDGRQLKAIHPLRMAKHISTMETFYESSHLSGLASIGETMQIGTMISAETFFKPYMSLPIATYCL